MSKCCLIESKALQISTTDESLLWSAVDNIRDIITLCTNNIIRIIIDEFVFKRILESNMCPFPIDYSQVENSKLKGEIDNLNRTFIESVKRNFQRTNSFECTGEQEFELCDHSRELLNYDDNYEMFSLSLLDCYDKDINVDTILINKNYTNTKTSSINISCNCANSEYSNLINVISPSEFITPDIIAFKKLKAIGINGLYIESPEVVKADHHNSYDDSNFRNYGEFPRKNKMVLGALRKFGLQKIHFFNYHIDSSKIAGSINDCIYIKTESETNDIIEGWLYTFTGFKVKIQMYFPREIGECLFDCIGDEFNYLKVSNLLTRLP